MYCNLIFSLLVIFNIILVGSNLFVPKIRSLAHGTNKFEPTIKRVCMRDYLVTSSSCSYSYATKNLFDQHDISYQEIDLLKDSEQALQLLIESGQRTVPHSLLIKNPLEALPN